jgi:hypothetical protein
MMKKIILLFLVAVMVFSISLSAIDQENKNLFFRLSLLPVGGGVEFGLSENVTILAQVGMGLNLIIIEGDTEVLFPKFLSLSGRYYYNLKSRERQGKRVYGFSANYIGVFAKYVFQDSDTELRGFIGPMWGLQRTLGNKAFFDFSLGLGMDFLEDRSTRFGAQASVSLGFTF